MYLYSFRNIECHGPKVLLVMAKDLNDATDACERYIKDNGGFNHPNFGGWNNGEYDVLAFEVNEVVQIDND